MPRFSIRKAVTRKSARRRPVPQVAAVAMATEKLQDRVVLSASPGTVIELGDGDVLDADSDDVMTDALTDVRETKVSEDLIVVDKSYRVTLAPVEIELGDTVTVNYSSLDLGSNKISVDSYAHVDAISGNGKSVITGTNVGGYDFVKITLFSFEEETFLERLDNQDLKVRVQTNIITTLVIPVLVVAPTDTDLSQYSPDSDDETQKEFSEFDEKSDGTRLFEESESTSDKDGLLKTTSTDETTKETDSFFSSESVFDDINAAADGEKFAAPTYDESKDEDDLLSAGLDVLVGKLWS